MIVDIPEPTISPDFTLNDIRKIREWNSARLKDATHEERLADSKQRLEEAIRVLGLDKSKIRFISREPALA